MATLGSFPPHNLSLLAKSHHRCLPQPSRLNPIPPRSKSRPSTHSFFPNKPERNWVVGSVTEDRKAADVPVAREDSTVEDNSAESAELRASDFEAKGESGDLERLVSRGINATIVLGFGTLAVTKLLTVDHDYWHVSGEIVLLFA